MYGAVEGMEIWRAYEACGAALERARDLISEMTPTERTTLDTLTGEWDRLPSRLSAMAEQGDSDREVALRNVEQLRSVIETIERRVVGRRAGRTAASVPGATTGSQGNGDGSSWNLPSLPKLPGLGLGIDPSWIFWGLVVLVALYVLPKER